MERKESGGARKEHHDRTNGGGARKEEEGSRTGNGMCYFFSIVLHSQYVPTASLMPPTYADIRNIQPPQSTANSGSWLFMLSPDCDPAEYNIEYVASVDIAPGLWRLNCFSS